MTIEPVEAVGDVFEAALHQAQTRWDLAVLLLETWRGAEIAAPHRTTADDDVRDAFYDLVDVVRAYFAARHDDIELTDEDREEVLRWTERGEQLVAVDAVGHGLNMACWPTFAASWQARLGPGVHTLSPGDPFPVPEASWPETLGGQRRTPPSRAGGYRDDEHPYVRVHRDGPLAVEVDFALGRPLRALLDGLWQDDHVLAALLPNDDLGQLGITGPRRKYHPIAPADVDDQRARVLGLLERAIEADARLIVLPELSMTASLADEVKARIDRDAVQRLVVCGSWHTTVDGAPANVSHGIVSGRDERLEHRKLTEVSDLLPVAPEDRFVEGITFADPPVLRVHVAGAYRVAILICKDSFDRRVLDRLQALAVNVLLVPAMSPDAQWFVDHAHANIAASQAVTLAANGPMGWGELVPFPAALLARPYGPEATVSAPAADAPAGYVFRLAQHSAESL